MDEVLEHWTSINETKGNLDWPAISQWIKPKCIKVDAYLTMSMDQRELWGSNVGSAAVQAEVFAVLEREIQRRTPEP
jgi:hypothetical protein